MTKKHKEIISLLIPSIVIFLFFLIFIGLQHFFDLFIALIGFTLMGYLLFRFLPKNIAGWISFPIFIAVIAYSYAGETIWNKSMTMYMPGYFLGVQLGMNFRKVSQKK